MWFKNLSLYRFTTPFSLSQAELAEKLETKQFRPVGKIEPSSTGWSSPLGREGVELLHAANGCLMICCKSEEKVLPASAVKELVDSRADEIEEAQGRKVRGKARLDLKDEVLLEMMPRAFAKSSRTFGYLDLQEGWLVIDAASSKKAEVLISLLRESIGSLPVIPFTVTVAPQSAMTEWLSANSQPGSFELENECELRDQSDEAGIIRVRNQPLDSGEIQAHLEAGMQVTRLAMSFDERISFVLDEKLAVKRLRFLDLIQDESEQVETETSVDRFDADFSIMSLELRRFLKELIEALGGFEERQ